MCRFCHQHGEGKKWYLKAENHSQDLLADMRRRRFMTDFILEIANGDPGAIEQKLQQAMKAPRWLRNMLYQYYEMRYRRDHFGQVVPLEDLERMLDLTSCIVRLPCICRKNTTGRKDARYCIGLSLDPEKLLDVKQVFLETFHTGPEGSIFERLRKDETLELLADFEHHGLIHTVWTFKTPFIGAICNCDRADCLAMVTQSYGLRLFFRAEYVAVIDQELCSGCRRCLPLCQFGAMAFSDARGKAFIDPWHCYGCGLCRVHCEQGAIHLLSRTEHPIARRLW